MKKQSIYRSCKLIAISSIISDQYSIYFTFISPLDSLDCWVSSVHSFRPPSLTSDSQPQNYKSDFIFCVVLQFSTLSYRKSDNSPCTLLLALGVFFSWSWLFSLWLLLFYLINLTLLCCPPAPPLTSLLACIICVWSRWYILSLLFFCWTDWIASTLSHRLDSFLIKFLGFKQGVSTSLLVNRRRGSFQLTLCPLKPISTMWWTSNFPMVLMCSRTCTSGRSSQ